MLSSNFYMNSEQKLITYHFHRHREIGFSPVRLAVYTLALNTLCMDPRQFHGHDLIGTLQHHEPPTDYDFALTALATCSSQAHVRKRQIRRLLDIANAAQDHNIGNNSRRKLFRLKIFIISSNLNLSEFDIYFTPFNKSNYQK